VTCTCCAESQSPEAGSPGCCGVPADNFPEKNCPDCCPTRLPTISPQADASSVELGSVSELIETAARNGEHSNQNKPGMEFVGQSQSPAGFPAPDVGALFHVFLI